MTANIRDASVYTNLSGLNAISALGREDSSAGLREVAVQFEAMFLNMMLKGMRAGEDVLFSENMLRSNEMTFHRENLDNQLSLHMASTGGIGLAHALHRQLMQRYEVDATDTETTPTNLGDARQFVGVVNSGAPQTASMANTNRMDSINSFASANNMDNPVRSVEPRLPSRLPLVSQSSHDQRRTTPVVFSTPQEFVEHLLPIAERVAPELGVDPTVLLAQSALETGWGQKMIRSQDGRPSHNLFGIKAGTSWAGDSVNVSTLEFRDGLMVREQASFRAYDSFEDSFRDYVQLIRSQSRYASAVQHAANPDAYGYHLQRAGYATDPEYAEKVSRVMRSPVMQDALSQARFHSTDSSRVN
jgi:peptidoglycan hydrolase FlgJ